MPEITVIKRDHTGKQVWRYTGEIIDSGANSVCLQARFNRDYADIGVLVFERGDLMTEWFYRDRWYNIFKVQDGDGERLKGYYCNITRPAEITAQTVAADDLALDVVVNPSGEITVLDEDEFAAIDIPDADRRAALDAVAQLRQAVQNRVPPFDALGSSHDRRADQTPES